MKLAVLLLALAVLGPLHGSALAPVVLTAAGAVGWFLIDCLRWPAVLRLPAGPTYVRGFA